MLKGRVPNGDGEGERKRWYKEYGEVLCSAGTDVVALWLEDKEGDVGMVH
jgi:hypothetical protein